MIANNEIPEVTFTTRELGEDGKYVWKHHTPNDLFGNKKVIVFALPGAFTPTCSTRHLPDYEKLYSELTKHVDDVYCVSVNDGFVMSAWKRIQGIQKVKLLPDGNGNFTRQMGMLVDKSNLDFGMRSWRYSMIVNNKVIEKMFIEDGYSDNCPDDPFAVSDVETMLKYLRGHG